MDLIIDSTATSWINISTPTSISLDLDITTRFPFQLKKISINSIRTALAESQAFAFLHFPRQKGCGMSKCIPLRCKPIQAVLNNAQNVFYTHSITIVCIHFSSQLLKAALYTRSAGHLQQKGALQLYRETISLVPRQKLEERSNI